MIRWFVVGAAVSMFACASAQPVRTVTGPMSEEAALLEEMIAGRTPKPAPAPVAANVAASATEETQAP